MGYSSLGIFYAGRIIGGFGVGAVSLATREFKVLRHTVG